MALALALGFWYPLAALAMLAVWPTSYALQAFRIAARKHRGGSDRRFALRYGALLTIGKFAELVGVVRCWVAHIMNRQVRLIEYKRPA